MQDGPLSGTRTLKPECANPWQRVSEPHFTRTPVSSIPAYIRIAEQIKAEWVRGESVSEGSKLPTQEELTERFGVSRSTIIRALSKLVAEGCLTSQQGSGFYVAQAPARGNGVRSIGMIVPNLHATVIVATCRGVERRARQLGYQVLLGSSEFGIRHEQELAEQHIQAGAQGLVIYPVTRRAQELETDYLTQWPQQSPTVPIVTVDTGYEEWTCSRVQFDNYRLGYDVTQQLIRHKHRHIAFMHIWPDYLHTSILEREKGWRAAMEEAGLEIPASYHTQPVPSTRGFTLPTPKFAPTYADYDAFAENLLKLSPRPDALIAWTDIVAAQLTQALNNRGVKVPDEIRITGFDCDPLVTRFFRPLFPTSKPDFVRLGEMAVDTLAGRLSGKWEQPRVTCHSVPVAWREPHTSQTPEALEAGWEEMEGAS